MSSSVVAIVMLGETNTITNLTKRHDVCLHLASSLDSMNDIRL